MLDPKNRSAPAYPQTPCSTYRQSVWNALKGVVDSVMIGSEPFAVADGALRHTMIIDIGAGPRTSV